MESHATTVLDLRGHFSSITKMNVLGLGLDLVTELEQGQNRSPVDPVTYDPVQHPTLVSGSGIGLDLVRLRPRTSVEEKHLPRIN